MTDPRPTVEELEQRSEELEEQIQATRRKAEADGLLGPKHHGPTLADPEGD